LEREAQHFRRDIGLGEGHAVLYLVYSELVGVDPDAILPSLAEHLTFHSDLDSKEQLVIGGPLETPDATNSGHGIYVPRVPSLAAAQRIKAD